MERPTEHPRVVLEDPDFVVVYKPAGMHTAPLEPGEPGTLLAWVLERYPEVGGVPGRKPVEPGLLHRLDRDTSGLVVVARTPPARLALEAAASEGRFLKGYEAWVSVHRDPPPGRKELLSPVGVRGEWAAWLARMASLDGLPPLPLVVESAFRAWGPGRRFVVAKEPGSRGVAVGARIYRTRILALRPLCPGSAGAEPSFSASVEIESGFRHQIRVHLASVGLPIVGDPLYGRPEGQQRSAGLRLQATRVQFPHPRTGTRVSVELGTEAGWRDSSEGSAGPEGVRG